MITASHNPPIYNGIKFIPSYGGPATNDITVAIERLIPDEPPKHDGYTDLKRAGMIYGLDPIEAYLEKLRGLLSVDSLKMKIVIDPMHGATSGIADFLLRGLGAEVKTIRSEIDPNFGGTIPDPTPSNLRELTAATQKSASDLGVALDGDGDRVAAVTNKGEVLVANQILPLIYLHLIENRSLRGDAARTVATSHLLDSVAAAHGRSIIETPVGFKYIGALLRERKVIVGGEESGGISLVTHIPEKDGIASALLLAESIIMSGCSLSDMMNSVSDRYGRFESSRIDFDLESNNFSLESLEGSLGSEVLGKKILSINKMDGIKILLEGSSWLLFRPSGTETVVRVYAESPTRSDTERLLDFGSRALRASFYR